MKKMVPHVLKLEFLREIPKKLADFIIQKIQGFLPEGFQDIFASGNASSIQGTSSDFSCNEGSDGADKLDSDRQEIWNQFVGDGDSAPKVEEEKLIAFLKLANKNGAKTWSRLTAERAKKLAPALMQVSKDDLAQVTAGRKPSSDLTPELQNFIQDSTKLKPGEKTPSGKKPLTVPGNKKLWEELKTSPWDTVGNGRFVLFGDKNPMLIAGKTASGTRFGSYAYTETVKRDGQELLKVSASGPLIVLDVPHPGDSIILIYSNKKNQYDIISLSPIGGEVKPGDEVFAGGVLNGLTFNPSK